MTSRRTILGIGILVSFALLIFSISLYYDFQHNQMVGSRISIDQMNDMTKEELIDHLSQRRQSQNTFYGFYIIPFFAFIGVIVGTLVYYIMADKVVKEKNSSIKNARVILNFLNPDERKVISEIVEREGKCPQYEISHLPGMNKVKTHRAIKNLESKNILRKESYGKVNKIILDETIYDVLKEDKR